MKEFLTWNLEKLLVVSLHKVKHFPSFLFFISSLIIIQFLSVLLTYSWEKNKENFISIFYWLMNGLFLKVICRLIGKPDFWFGLFLPVISFPAVKWGPSWNLHALAWTSQLLSAFLVPTLWDHFGSFCSRLKFLFFACSLKLSRRFGSCLVSVSQKTIFIWFQVMQFFAGFGELQNT